MAQKVRRAKIYFYFEDMWKSVFARNGKSLASLTLKFAELAQSKAKIPYRTRSLAQFSLILLLRDTFPFKAENERLF